MKLSIKTLLFLIVAIAIFSAGPSVVFAAGGASGLYGDTFAGARGTGWSGTAFANLEIVDVSGLPAGLPDDAAPAQFNDRVVKVDFVFMLEPDKGKGAIQTFSCLAVYEPTEGEEYYQFYAINDYLLTKRLGMAFQRCLENVVYPVLCDTDCTGALKEAVEPPNPGNVDEQLGVGGELIPGEPLFWSVNIEVVAPCTNCP